MDERSRDAEISTAARTATDRVKLLYNLRTSPPPPYTNLVNYALADLDADVRARCCTLFPSFFHLLFVASCLFLWTLFALGASCIHYARRNLIYRRNKSREASQSACPGCLYHDALPTIQSPPFSFVLRLFSCICFFEDTGTLKLRLNYPSVAVLVCPLACFGGNTFVKNEITPSPIMPPPHLRITAPQSYIVCCTA